MKSKLFFAGLFLFFSIQLNAENKTENQNSQKSEYLAQVSFQEADTTVNLTDLAVVNEELDEEKKGAGRKILFVVIIILLSLSFIGYRFSKYKE